MSHWTIPNNAMLHAVVNDAPWLLSKATGCRFWFNENKKFATLLLELLWSWPTLAMVQVCMWKDFNATVGSLYIWIIKLFFSLTRKYGQIKMGGDLFLPSFLSIAYFLPTGLILFQLISPLWTCSFLGTHFANITNVPLPKTAERRKYD